MRKSIDGLMAIVRIPMNWIHTATPCSCSVEDAVTESRRFILKSYPQPFVIRIFLPFILRYARFSGKNMRIKIILDRRCGKFIFIIRPFLIYGFSNDYSANINYLLLLRKGRKCIVVFGCLNTGMAQCRGNGFNSDSVTIRLVACVRRSICG